MSITKHATINKLPASLLATVFILGIHSRHAKLCNSFIIDGYFSYTQPYYTFFILQNTKSSRKEIIFDSSLSFPKSVSEGRLFIKKFWK